MTIGNAADIFNLTTDQLVSLKTLVVPAGDSGSLIFQVGSVHWTVGALNIH